MGMPLISLDPRDAEYIRNSRADASVKPRITIERVIVRRLIEALLAAGYHVSIDASGERGYDRESPEIENSRDLDAIMAAIMASDDEHVFVSLKPTTEGPFDAYVYLVYGNDGWDVISDYQTNLEEVLKPVNDFADTLSDGALFVIDAPADPLRDELLTIARGLTLATEEGDDKAMGTHYLAKDNFIRCKGSFLELVEKARAAVAKVEGGAA